MGHRSHNTILNHWTFKNYNQIQNELHYEINSVLWRYFTLVYIWEDCLIYKTKALRRHQLAISHLESSYKI